MRKTARSSGKSYWREPARLATTARQPVSSHKRSNARAAPTVAPGSSSPRRRRRRPRRWPCRRSARQTATAAPIARSGAALPGDRAWRRPAGAPPRPRRFSTIWEIGVSRRRSSFEKTWRGTEEATHFVAHTKSAIAPAKSSAICEYVAPRFRESATPVSIISTICAPHSGRNCRRSAKAQRIGAEDEFACSRRAFRASSARRPGPVRAEGSDAGFQLGGARSLVERPELAVRHVVAMAQAVATIASRTGDACRVRF